MAVAELDTSKPHSARMYDYYLGGKDNYETDREAANAVAAVFPTVKQVARVNRDFMTRVTMYLATKAGVRQFLDIGTGIPTAPNLHQTAQEVDPATRVVYIDNDPLVLAHARALMTGTNEGRTAYIDADVRDPEAILHSPRLRETLDLTQPVALSLIAIMHFIADDYRPHDIIATLLDALAPGSYLAMTHAARDFDPDGVANAAAIYQQRGISTTARSRQEFTRFFAGLDLVEPGITVPHRWQAGIEPPPSWDASVSFHAAVGRK
jgi:SAM-dependent methyltransferase